MKKILKHGRKAAPTHKCSHGRTNMFRAKRTPSKKVFAYHTVIYLNLRSSYR